MKNKSFTRIYLIGLILVLFLALPQTVYAEETDLTEEIISEIRGRLDQALQAGERSADLADMNIIVNMYTDGFGAQYQKVLDLCDDAVKENGSFILGSHKEPYVSFSPQVEPAEGSNEFGVGPNWLRSIGLYYDEYYCFADGSPDLERIDAVQEQVTREYQAALSVVSEDMNDVEKALALYDYIIAVSNYPDVESMDENGIAAYDSESYYAISVFRDHISVCLANATAYCYLLSDCGIPCIRVDSDEMWHSWVMLYVDGAWYHADPTWDNRRYEDGLTSLGDLNDDNWDLGAAGHHYFLKSDEEMTSRLEHYDWFLTMDYTEDHSVDKTPVSGPSGSFEDLFFGDGNIWQEDVHYNYMNGSWYFLDRYKNRIVRTAYGEDMGEVEYLDPPSENVMKYVYSSGDCLLICEESGIWRYDTRDGKMEKLALLEKDPDRGEPVFTEMNVASGTLNGVAYYSYWSADPVAVSFSFPVEELLQTAAVPGTEEPVVTETEPESEEDTAAPTKEDPREETTERKGENSPEKRAGEATEPAEPHDNHFGIWTAVLLCLVAAAVVTGILFYRRRTK